MLRRWWSSSPSFSLLGRLCQAPYLGCTFEVDIAPEVQISSSRILSGNRIIMRYCSLPLLGQTTWFLPYWSSLANEFQLGPPHMLGTLNECFRAGISATDIRKVDTAMVLCCSEVLFKERTSSISFVAVLIALPIAVTGYISKTSSSSNPMRGIRRSKPNTPKVR